MCAGGAIPPDTHFPHGLCPRYWDLSIRYDICVFCMPTSLVRAINGIIKLVTTSYYGLYHLDLSRPPKDDVDDGGPICYECIRKQFACVN